VSTEAVRPFLPTLRRLDGELALPLPNRVEMLRELEADLEELTRSLVDQGHPIDEAREMALETLVPDRSSLGELRRLHAPPYARLTHRLGEARVRLIERSTLAAAALVVMVVEAATLLGTGVGRDPSPFLWPVLALSGVLFAAIVAKAFTLWIKKDHGRVRVGVGAILILSGAVLAVGFGGALADLYRLAAILERIPEDAGTLVLRWATRDAAVVSVAMLASMAGGLTWFVLTQWLSAVESARAETLGLRAIHSKNSRRKHGEDAS
jgi:hypothetical protein